MGLPVLLSLVEIQCDFRGVAVGAWRVGAAKLFLKTRSSFRVFSLFLEADCGHGAAKTAIQLFLLFFLNSFVCDFLLEQQVFFKKALILVDEEGDKLVDVLDGVGG
jgi:hypothetical protein